MSLIYSYSEINTNIVNVSYNGITRPITYVWNPYLTPYRDYKPMATGITLYAFKDLIPDWQKYSRLTLTFNSCVDKEGELVLQPLEFTYEVETLGHGSININVKNTKLVKFVDCEEIYKQITQQTGFKMYSTDLCDADGVKIQKNGWIPYDSNKTLLFALFKSDGPALQTIPKIAPGKLVKFIITEHPHRDTVIQFYESDYEIHKRSPKSAVVILRVDEELRRKKIYNENGLEYVLLCGGQKYTLKPDNINYGEKYLFDPK